MKPDIHVHQAHMDTDGPWRRTSCRPWKGAPSECHLVTTGTSESTVATVQWRNGPQGLRDDDDDDNDDDDELDGWVSYIDITDLNFQATQP